MSTLPLGSGNTAQNKMEGSLPSRHSYSYRGLITEGIRAGHGSPGVWVWAWMDREPKGQGGLPGGVWPQHTRRMSRVDQTKGRWLSQELSGQKGCEGDMGRVQCLEWQGKELMQRPQKLGGLGRSSECCVTCGPGEMRCEVGPKGAVAIV